MLVEWPTMSFIMDSGITFFINVMKVCLSEYTVPGRFRSSLSFAQCFRIPFCLPWLPSGEQNIHFVSRFASSFLLMVWRMMDPASSPIGTILRAFSFFPSVM